MRAFAIRDLPEINSWLIVRGIPEITMEDCPKRGMIVEGVGCGFLIFTDTNICFLECFVTNPGASAEARNKAINQITKWALNMASSCGFKTAMMISGEESFIKRAESLGFTITQKSVGMKTL